MRFELNDPLHADQWRAVDEAALQILETTGMNVPHARAVEVLGRRPGFRVEGDRVRFDRQCVRDTIRTVKGTSGYDTAVISGAYAHNYLDPETGKIRPSTLADLVVSVRQADALGSGVCAPVVPLDVPGPVQEIVMERVTHENCRFSYGGGQTTTVAAAEASLEMSAVVNRPHELEIRVTSPPRTRHPLPRPVAPPPGRPGSVGTTRSTLAGWRLSPAIVQPAAATDARTSGQRLNSLKTARVSTADTSPEISTDASMVSWVPSRTMNRRSAIGGSKTRYSTIQRRTNRPTQISVRVTLT